MIRLKAKVTTGAVIGLLLLGQGCQLGGVKAVNSEPVPNHHGAGLNKLISVRLGTHYSEIVREFGEPDAVVGSGFLIIMYKLPDGRRIYLNFGAGNTLEEISETDKDGSSKLISSPFLPKLKPPVSNK